MQHSTRTPFRRALAAAVAPALLASGCSEPGPDGRNNAWKVIRPYRAHGTWVFDDPATGLKGEPFVQGVPGMIDGIADADAERGFRLTFSAAEVPEWSLKIVCGERYGGGAWYTEPTSGRRGWLCPALFKSFRRAPDAIHARADPLR